MQLRPNPVLSNNPLHLPTAIGKMRVYLGLGQPVVVQKINAGVREFSIQGAQVREVEGKVMAVIDAGEKPDQTCRLTRPRMLFDGLDDFLQSDPCPLPDLL